MFLLFVAGHQNVEMIKTKAENNKLENTVL
jgi:hypothetical protein